MSLRLMSDLQTIGVVILLAQCPLTAIAQPGQTKSTQPTRPDTATRFWAFEQPTEHPLPTIQRSTWPRRDLDHFVLAALEQAGLSPSPDATSSVLLRRLHIDLIGLPPTPETAEQFRRLVAQTGVEQALAAEVDRLLQSKQFGERWGRHWLDVARFAESSGKETNVSFPHAWRYRDYVIDSVNSDKPFDRFVTEQLAGDLLPHQNDAERAELLVATGFLAVGPKSLNEMNPKQFRADVVDEQIDTVTRALMACTVACARCHDHKSDPFTMRDYYGMAGVFMSSETFFGTSLAPGNQVGGDLIHLPRLAGQVIPNKSLPPQRVKQLRDELAALKQEKKDRQAAARKAVQQGKDPNEFFSLRDALRILWRSGGIEGKLKTVENGGRARPLAMGVQERNSVGDAALLERGEIKRPKEPVPRGFPAAVGVQLNEPIPKTQSGRLELAAWLTDPRHPLTARVFVNRVWRHLIGSGIVRTMDNFGADGARPSHPRLLDNLSIKFVAEGWSLKAVVREIVLSRTYRQASRYRPDAFEKDPENRLAWRANKRRLDAEVIRDSMLAVSGLLVADRPKGSLIAQIGDRPISIIAFDKRVPADLDGARHRSVYLPVLRDRLPDVLELFDCAEPSLVTGNRQTTNVPMQALYLMNSAFVQTQSKALAERICSRSDMREARIRHAFLLCFARLPDPAEIASAERFFETGHELETTETQLWQAYCQALLATAEFRNVD